MHCIPRQLIGSYLLERALMLAISSLARAGITTFGKPTSYTKWSRNAQNAFNSVAYSILKTKCSLYSTSTAEVMSPQQGIASSSMMTKNWVGRRRLPVPSRYGWLLLSFPSLRCSLMKDSTLVPGWMRNKNEHHFSINWQAFSKVQIFTNVQIICRFLLNYFVTIC